MGRVKETKLDNGMAGLEITYGGKDAPFGGVDSSAPPMYIDGNCFTDANGFVVLNEQLIAAGWKDSGVTLGSWNSLDFVGSGCFFVGGRYKNFVLGASETLLVNPAGTRLNFSIWVWESGTTGTIAVTDSLNVVQGAEFTNATPSQCQLSISNSYKVTVNVTVTVTVNASAVNVVFHTTDTPQQLATAIAAAINGAGGYPCTAAVNSDGLTITLTTVALGSASNATTITISYSPTSQPKNGVNVFSGFSGATDSYTIPSGRYGAPLSWVAVGETIYLAGFGGTVMLSYTEISGVPQLSVLTQYLCANTLSKFNGQLIAAGITLGPGLRLTSPEMIIAWSAPNALGVWNPLNADGTVTGAGFNQESDISDYLTGLLVSRGAAIFLRTEGVDYITPLGNSTIPFDFAHISNAVRGEGCQDSRLVTQYDQVGAFVGNSDIYEFAGGLNPIGNKIKNTIQFGVNNSLTNRGATSGPFGIAAENVEVLFFFLINYTIYVYCGGNKTWMMLPLKQLSGGNQNSFGLTFWKSGSFVSGQFQFNTYGRPVLVLQDSFSVSPFFLYLSEQVQNETFTHAMPSYVVFAQEEVAFGRDITIDGLLINVAGMPGQVINFSVSGQKSVRDGGGSGVTLTGSLTLPSTASTTVFANYQVFFSTSTQDVNTIQNPQLRLDVPVATGTQENYLSIAKIALFASFDPNQRPV